MVLDNGRGTGDFGAIRRVAMVSVHTSPLATLGAKDAGGLNVYVRELSRQLGRQGIAVDLFTRRTDPAMPEIVDLGGGVRVIHLTAGPARPVEKTRLIEHLAEFVGEMSRFRLRDGGVDYDVIHSHYWLSGCVARQLGCRWDVPTVHMFHTLGEVKRDAARGAADGWESAQRIAIERELMRDLDAIVAANARERAEMVWRYGAPARAIHLVPCGIDLARFHPADRDAARVALGLGSGPFLLFVGRIDPVKGIDFLIDGFAALRSRWTDQPPPRLLIVGGEPLDDGLGPDLARIRDLAVAKGLPGEVILLGPQPHDALPRYYAAADLVVVPSRYESFGLVAIEAMACGRPVVASRVGGLAHTIADGENGLLVPYGVPEVLADTLDRALHDAALLDRLATGGRATAGEYSWDWVARQIVAVYREVVARQALSAQLAEARAGD